MIFTGKRDARGEVTVRFIDGNSVEAHQRGELGEELPLRLDLHNHSPTGFEWGYNGSGPAQLALAVCAQVLGDDARALAVYQQVKEQVFAGIKAEEWSVTSEFIGSVILGIEAEGG